jgi:NADPH2:quinone reductase
MRAVVCHQLGDLDALAVEEREPLVPGSGQVTLRVRSAGVNYVDGLLCQGRYQIKPTPPFVPGGEVAGEVSVLGDGVTGVTAGDRVMAMTGMGGFADEVVVAVGSLLPMPDVLGFAQAAALIQSYGTAMFTLTMRTRVEPGETVLVLGAGGGVGLAMIDVATALGCRVIAAASSADKRVSATAMGAAATIAYEDEDLKARARELSEGGVDVVIDPVGGPHSEPALRATRAFGRYCVIGFASGDIASVPLNQVLLNNRTVVGVDWGAWSLRNGAANRALLDEVLAMVADGRLHPSAPLERPLGDAGRVMGELLERRLAGKVVLTP